MRGAWLGVLIGMSSACAHAWVQPPLDAEAVDTVWLYIKNKDCAGAARGLNEGIRKSHPSVLLLAGSMYEDGICLKQSWDRALGLYEQSHAAGHPNAAARIAAGYAEPAGGSDRAAALWWALKGRVALPKECKQVEPLLDDANGFVAVLQGWPASRLAGCAYVAGVMSAMSGDVEFSKRAASYGLKGVVTTTFHPADNKFDVSTDEVEFIQLGGVTSGDVMRDHQTRSVKQEFERDIRAAADRAVKRYSKPLDIEPSWRVTMTFSFSYVLR